MTNEPTPADTNTSITEQPPAPSPPAEAGAEAPAPQPEATAPVMASEPGPSRLPNLDYVVLVFVLVLSFLLASYAATNSDLWLQLAVGKSISEGTFTFGVDPFSWATEGVYWVHQSWLTSWLMFQVYTLAGGAALVIAKAVLFVAAIGLVCRIGWTEGNRWFAVIFALLAALAISSRGLALQPVVISYLFLAITLYLLDRAGVFAMEDDAPAEAPRPDRARLLWCLPPLFALWANLDAWFILGPLVLALCWAGVGLARWLSGAGTVPGKTLGLVFGVGLLACMLNPYHVHVFQLPPELAYVVLSLTDPIGIPWPDAIMAGGRTAREIHRADPGNALTYSPLASVYWQNSSVGRNVAGIAIYPLLLLGLAAFTLVALIRPQPGAPRLQSSRFLVWLAFGVMALTLVRMIPFFALVSAPLTAMTLGEFLAWQQRSNAISGARRERGMNLARLLSLPFLLLMVYFAWPGWLHGAHTNNEFGSPRRVVWEVRADPSLVRAALTLNALHEKGECGNVFNLGNDLAAGNYLAWHAPGVKYYLDTRYALYPKEIVNYYKARAALVDPTASAADWHTLFKDHGVDQLMLAQFPRDEEDGKKNWFDSSLEYTRLRLPRNLVGFWIDMDHWWERYDDRRTQVLSWSGGAKKPWPFGVQVQALNGQAFGEVAGDQKPPRKGVDAAKALDFWTLYLDGVAPTPPEVGEASLWPVRVGINNTLMSPYRLSGLTLMTTSQIGLSALPNVASFYWQSSVWQAMPAPMDKGIPAAPILMMRDARRGLAANPHDPNAHMMLAEAVGFLRNFQEDHWRQVQQPGMRFPFTMRERLRQAQNAAALYQVVQLQPFNYEFQLRLADLYEQMNHLDSALDHRQLGFKELQESDRFMPKEFKKREEFLKQFSSKSVQPLEKRVRRHLEKLKEFGEAASPLQKVQIALSAKFKDFDDAKVVDAQMGLSKKALEILFMLDPVTLKNEGEMQAFLQMRMDLLLSLGRIDELEEDLRRVKDAMPPPLYATYQFFAAGVRGNYDAMDDALAILESAYLAQEKMFAAELKNRSAHLTSSMIFVPSLSSGIAIPTMTLPAGILFAAHADIANKHAGLKNELYNTMTLRGITALEAGDTRRARTLLRNTLNAAGDTLFAERPLAQRYLELLDKNLSPQRPSDH